MTVAHRQDRLAPTTPATSPARKSDDATPIDVAIGARFVFVHFGHKANSLIRGPLQVIGLPAHADPVQLVYERYAENQKRQYCKQKPNSHGSPLIHAENNAQSRVGLGSHAAFRRTSSEMCLRDMRELRHDIPL
jgi:hypothetical protein